MRLRNKVAIVTGGSSGFGRATSVRFGEEGARVVVADLDEEWGKQTVSLVEQAGGQASLIVADVATTAGAGAVVGHALERFGALDVLVNNAGIAQRDPEDSWNTPEATWDEVLRVNLKSVYLCSKFAIPHMLERGAGAIVSVASIAASCSVGGSAYGAAIEARRVGSLATRDRSHARSPLAASGSTVCRRATCGLRCRPASVEGCPWKSRIVR
jgi:NAD(P)-dependent dehydrogenase (short-subunit alcohol dehydrogenase family)